MKREEKWSAHVAIGDERFVQGFKEKLGVKGRSREVVSDNEGCSLHEDGVEYGFDVNSLAWDDDVFCG